VRFFLDNNLAAKIAKGLNGFVSPKHQVAHLKDLFAANADDADWMKKLAEQGEWIIITADFRIGKNPHEVEAWKQAGHTIFFLKPGWLKMNFWDQAHKFVKCFPDIIESAKRAKRGASFIVSVNGKIEG
jgi:PIN like domain